MWTWLRNIMISDVTERHIKSMLELIVLELAVLKRKVNEIMGAIKDFSDKMKLHNDAVDQAVSGIAGDIQELNDKITALQNSQGAVTTEDQALLDDLEQRGAALATKIAALDALTPPPAPPVPPTA